MKVSYVDVMKMLNSNRNDVTDGETAYNIAFVSQVPFITLCSLQKTQSLNDLFISKPSLYLNVALIFRVY